MSRHTVSSLAAFCLVILAPACRVDELTIGRGDNLVVGVCDRCDPALYPSDVACPQGAKVACLRLADQSCVWDDACPSTDPPVGGGGGAPGGQACHCDGLEIPAIGCASGEPSYECVAENNGTCRWDVTCADPSVKGCAPVACDIDCRLGFARDANGCETCACVTDPNVAADIVWGGEHVELTQTAAGASLTFDCAAGTIDAPLGASGTFTLAGTYTAGSGGPAGPTITPSRPATYTVRVSGDRMTVDILVNGRDRLGPYTLTRDRRGELYLCL